MYAKNVLLIACAAGGLVSCTTRPDPETMGPPGVQVPPPEIRIELPLEERLPRDPLPAQACLLSTARSCRDLDPRPFGPCLSGTPGCHEKGEGGIRLLEGPEALVVDKGGPQSR